MRVDAEVELLAESGEAAMSPPGEKTRRPRNSARFVLVTQARDGVAFRRVAGEREYQILQPAHTRARQLLRMGLRGLYVEEWAGRTMQRRIPVLDTDIRSTIQNAQPTVPGRGVRLSNLAFLRRHFGPSSVVQIMGDTARVTNAQGRKLTIDCIETFRREVSVQSSGSCLSHTET